MTTAFIQVKHKIWYTDEIKKVAVFESASKIKKF